MPGSTVDVRTPDGVADAYLARPEGRTTGVDAPGEQLTYPGVLFVMDAFGLRAQIEKMADRIAEHGYVVLAPNVFYRSGRSPVIELPDLRDPEQRGTVFEKLRPLIAELTPERIVADGGAYLDYLAQLAETPLAITGYCMGARIGWRIAAAHPDRVAALGGFHAGGLVTDDEDSPHKTADKLKGVELYFGHADNDRSMTPEQIKQLDQALEQAAVEHRAEVYDGAAHGYTMADTAAYDEDAAERHFTELLSLLDRTLAH
jgi:carboxymethylenebutenolidase